MKRAIFTLAALFAALAGPALAHTGIGPVSGMSAGFAHPIGGLDHVLAMIAVGILAVQQGGRSLWLVPAAFVAMMIVGGGLAFGNVPIPYVEQGIVGSVIILGAVIALGHRLPLAAAMSLAGVLAVFHGHAHGAEMPATASGLDYAIGFAAATAFLHAAGIGFALGAQKAGAALAPIAVRLGGATIAAAGVAMAAL